MTENQVWVKALHNIPPLSAMQKVHKMLEDCIELATATIHAISITFYGLSYSGKWRNVTLLPGPHFPLHKHLINTGCGYFHKVLQSRTLLTQLL